MKIRKIGMIVLTLLLSITFNIGCGRDTDSDVVTFEEKQVEGLKFTEVKIEYEEEEEDSTITLRVTNVDHDSIRIEKVLLTLHDENGETSEFGVYIMETLEKGASVPAKLIIKGIDIRNTRTIDFSLPE